MNPCRELVISYILYQNPLYTYSFPIALLCAIIIYGMAVAAKWSNNSYVTQLILPIATIIIVMTLINWIVRAGIQEEEIHQYSQLCDKIFRM